MDEEELSRAQHDVVVPAGPALRPIADRAWDVERARIQGRRHVTIDLEALAYPLTRGVVGDTLANWISVLATSSYAERFQLLGKAVVGLIAQNAPYRAPEARPRPISTVPASDPNYRRCVRVLAMVHELHKAGYQRVRILPMLSPSGCYWRGVITFADNVADDGFHIIDEDMDNRLGWVARYTSGQDNEFFGWRDAQALNARQLAQLFIERFPVIASRGEGCDWAYSGWLTDVLGQAEAGPERGELIHLIQDWPTDPAYLARWQPPPPIR